MKHLLILYSSHVIGVALITYVQKSNSFLENGADTYFVYRLAVLPVAV